MKTSSKFRIFCNNLAIDYQNKRAKRLKFITKRLNKDFWNHDSDNNHSFYVGSHGRHTAIKGPSDIDIVFYLPSRTYSRYNSYSGNGQSALLQDIKKSLQKTHLWKTSIKGDGQVIVANFSDNMKFEIVPAFLLPDGQYVYPDSNSGGRWKDMNPKAEIQEFLNVNKDIANGNLILLCRMIRAWKSKRSVPIQGVLIDTLAYNFFKKRKYKGKDYSCYPQMLCSFFKYLASQRTEQSYWLTPGSRQRIPRKGKFEYKAKQAYNLVLQATKQEKKLKNHLANKTWRKVFGQQFPVGRTSN